MGVHSDPSPLGTLRSTAAAVVLGVWPSTQSPTVHFNGRTSTVPIHLAGRFYLFAARECSSSTTPLLSDT